LKTNCDESIKIIEETDCRESKFVNVRRLRFEQKGVEKNWDFARVHDSVAIVIYDSSKESFVLVRQFRPPVYIKNNDGFTYELCAGILDKDKSLAETAREEILEETGYDVDAESLERVTSFYTAVSFAASVQTIYYVEVDESMKVSEGGGIGTEDIELVYLSVRETKEFLFDETKPKTPGILFALNWALENKEYNIKESRL